MNPTYGEPIRLVTACGHKRQVRWWVSDPLATALSVPQVTRCNRASCPRFRQVVDVVDAEAA